MTGNVPSGASLSPGQRVAGRYEVVRLLGEGGMGAVYEALHAELGRRVAVKVLRPEFSADRVAVERFRAEARTASELRHRNVVEVTDFGDDGGRLYLVMELLDGESLQALLDREGPLDAEVALKLVDPVLTALAWAHARAVVHRDVKPDNVFLARIPGEPEPVAKLLDFGIARGARADGVKLTQTGVMLGTPAYMAPEQAWNSAPLTPSADQWSAAAMLYEMLSGRIPHQCDALSELVARRVSQDPDDLATLRPSLPPKLCAVVMRALSREVSARFPSIEAFAEALRDTASDVAAPSPPVTAPPVTAPPVTAPPVTAPPITAPPRAPGLDATAEAPLAPVDPPPPEPPPAVPPPDAPPAQPPIEPIARDPVAEREPPPPPPAWHRFAAALAAMSVIAVTAFALRRAESPHTQPATPTRVTRDAAIDEVVFTVHVTPASARITVDGAYVGVGHAAVRRPRSGERHDLRVEAPGFAPHLDVLRADTDQTLTLQLTADTPTAPDAHDASTPTRRANTQPAATPLPRGARRIDTELPP
ncbi:MAG: protein kinase [Polyangiales bacterium]